jgi:hypothetical protein
LYRALRVKRDRSVGLERGRGEKARRGLINDEVKGKRATKKK